LVIPVQTACSFAGATSPK